MASLFRRAGAAIAKFFAEGGATPTPVPGAIQLYSDISGGKPELFARTDDGTIYQVTPPSANPNVNVLDEGVSIGGNPHSTLNFVGAGVTAVDAGAGVSTITIPGGGGGGATQYVFVFDPNGLLPAGPNIYTVFATLYADLILVSGFRILQFVNPASANIIVPNGIYDFTDVTWQGSPTVEGGSTPSRTNIQVGNTVAPAVTITGLRHFVNLDVFNNNGLPAPITDLISGEAIYMENVRFHVNGDPFIQILDGVNASIFMNDGSEIDGGDDGIGAVFVEDNATLNIFMQGEEPNCRLAESAIDGAALATLNINISSATDLSLTQPDFLGTVTVANNGNQRETVTQLSVAGIVQVGDSLGYGPRDFGTTYIYKNIASIAVVLDPGAGFTIDGAPTYALSGLNATATLVADGVTNWNVTSGGSSSSSSTSGSSAATGITWRPGSLATGPIVWDDWTAMYTYIDGLRTAALVSGDFELILDDQAGALEIPAGAWDFNRIFPVGVRAGIFGINAVQLDMDDAAIITNLASVRDLTVTGAPTAGFGIILDAGQVLLLTNTTFYDPGGSGAVVEVLTTATIRLGDNSGFRNTEGQIVVRIDDGASVTVIMEGSQSVIHQGTLQEDGTGAFEVVIGSSSAQCNLFQTATTEVFTQRVPHWEGVNTNPNGVVTAQQGFLLTNGGTIFINTDGGTTWVSYVAISGGGSPVATPTVERLTADGAANPDIDTTYVSGVGTDLTLANGTTDGFIKNFVVTSGSGTIVPANLADGNTLTYLTAPANVSFIWDDVNGTYHVYGNPYNMVTT